MTKAIFMIIAAIIAAAVICVLVMSYVACRGLAGKDASCPTVIRGAIFTTIGFFTPKKKDEAVKAA